MRANGYYLIRPLSAVVEIASQMDELSADVLTEVQLWESTEGDRSLWTSEDYCLRAKMAFLISLESDYGRAEGVRSVFGPEQGLSEELFDRFWSIEKVDLKANVDEVSVRSLESSQIQLPENELVRQWLSSRL